MLSFFMRRGGYCATRVFCTQKNQPVPVFFSLDEHRLVIHFTIQWTVPLFLRVFPGFLFRIHYFFYAENLQNLLQDPASGSAL